MAFTNSLTCVSLPQGEDLRQAYALLVHLDQNHRVVRCDSAGDIPIGVVVSAPNTDEVGEAVGVALIGGGGIGKVRLGAAVAAGTSTPKLLIPETTSVDADKGRASSVDDIAALAANNLSFGQPLETGAEDDIISFVAQVIAGPTA